jgi:hypothetical protein
MVRAAAEHRQDGHGAVLGAGAACSTLGFKQPAATHGCYFEPMKKKPLFLAAFRPKVAKDLAAASK